LAVFAASAVFLVGLIVLTKQNFIKEKLRFWGTATVLSMLIILLTVPNPLLNRIKDAGVSDSLAFERTGIFKSAVLMFKAKPFTGQGLGTFADVYSAFKLPVDGLAGRYGRSAQFAHNEYLNTAAELGIAGLILLFVGVALILLKACRSIQLAKTKTTALTALGALMALSAVFVHALVDFNLRFLPVMLVTVLSAAIVWSPVYFPVKLVTPSNKRLRVYTAVIIILVFFFVLSVFLGETVSSLAKGQEKEKTLKEALLLDALNAERSDALGLYYLSEFVRTKDNRALVFAEEHFKSATAKNRVNGYYKKHLGHTYAAWNMFLEAEKEYLAAIELCPNEPFFRFELSGLYLLMRNIPDAEKQLEEAVRIEPNYLLARERLGKMYLDSGHMNEGVQQFKIAEEIYRNVSGDPASSYEERLLKRP